MQVTTFKVRTFSAAENGGGSDPHSTAKAWEKAPEADMDKAAGDSGRLMSRAMSVSGAHARSLFLFLFALVTCDMH